MLNGVNLRDCTMGEMETAFNTMPKEKEQIPINPITAILTKGQIKRYLKMLNGDKVGLEFNGAEHKGYVCLYEPKVF